MPVIVFNGRVLPEQQKFSNGARISSSYYAVELDQTLRLSTEIRNGMVETRCELERYSDDWLGNIWHYALNFTRIQVDLAAFVKGIPFQLWFDQVSVDGAAPQPFILKGDELAAIGAALPISGNEFVRLIQLIAADANTFLALSDIVSGFREPTQRLANYVRGIERLRNSLYPHEPHNSKERRLAWEHFRSKLGLADGYVEFISDASKAHRHGHLARVDPEMDDEVNRRAWFIVCKFLELRLANKI